MGARVKKYAVPVRLDQRCESPLSQLLSVRQHCREDRDF